MGNIQLNLDATILKKLITPMSAGKRSALSDALSYLELTMLEGHMRDPRAAEQIEELTGITLAVGGNGTKLASVVADLARVASIIKETVERPADDAEVVGTCKEPYLALFAGRFSAVRYLWLSQLTRVATAGTVELNSAGFRAWWELRNGGSPLQ